MRYINLRLLSVFVMLTVLISCKEDDTSLIDGLPDSIINTDPDGSPPRAMVESWGGYSEKVNRQILINGVGVFYDADVDREIEWPLSFYGKIWPEILSKYGFFGNGASLHVVGHGDAAAPTFSGNYLQTETENKNVIDLPITELELTAQTSDLSLKLLGQLVEGGNNRANGAPATTVWGESFVEIFTYDMYMALDLEADAERVKTAYLESTSNLPVAGTNWFQDWLLPIYENYNGIGIFSNFFSTIAEFYPTNGGSYVSDFTVGEFIHFWSGAAGDDLQPMFEEAFGWNDTWAQELVIAQAKYPDLPYPFTPASVSVDLTPLAILSVSNEHPNGAGNNEGSPKLVDNDINTKYLTNYDDTMYVQQFFPTPKVINKYSFTSANDAPDRDPKDWNLVASNDGTTWIQLDSKSDESFSGRFQTREWNIDNETAYQYYRIYITDNNGGSLIQIAEWRLMQLQIISFGAEDFTQSALITVNRDNTNGPSGAEGSFKLIDDDEGSKFLTSWDPTQPLQMQQRLLEASVVGQYTITSGNDAPGRDAKTWTLSGSNDNSTWTEIDSQTDQMFDERGQTRTFTVDNSTAYLYYRWEVTENNGAGLIQIGEWRLLSSD